MLLDHAVPTRNINQADEYNWLRDTYEEYQINR